MNLTRAMTMERTAAAAARQDFLAACWDQLGSTQREHVTSHCQAVSDLAGRLCRAMNLPAAVSARIRLAGLFHDIGKCAIPEALLAKPGPLTAIERRIVDHHAWLGGRYTLAITGDAALAEIVRRHHRPGAAARPADPAALQASIVQVADALVSMVSNRPYAPARPKTEALAELRRGQADQFDPRVVQAAHRAVVWPVAA